MYRNDKVIKRYSEPFKLKKSLTSLVRESTQRANFVNSTLLHLQQSMSGIKSIIVKT